MRLGAGLVLGLAFVVDASVGAAPTEGAGQVVPRYACIETAVEGELRVDLGSGQGGVWQGELTVTTVGGTSTLAGTAFDTSKVGGGKAKGKETAGRKAPKVKLKGKAVGEAQRVELLSDLTAAVSKPEEVVEDCANAVPHNVRLTWSCTNGTIKTAGDLSFVGDRCPGKTPGYTRAVGVTDWAVSALRKFGGR